jgi:hypothetical protein
MALTPKAGGAANSVTVTIPAGDSVSSSADLTGGKLAMILTPPDLDSGPVGRLNLSFLVSADDSQFYDLIDDQGAEVLRTVLAGRATNLQVAITQAPMFVKIRSGSRDNPVVQNADRAFTLLLILN